MRKSARHTQKFRRGFFTGKEKGQEATPDLFQGSSMMRSIRGSKP